MLCDGKRFEMRFATIHFGVFLVAYVDCEETALGFDHEV